MANIRVKDLPNTSAPAADTDEFIIDSSSAGTRRLNYGELKTAISGDFQAGTSTYKVATLGSDNKLDPAQIPDTLSQGLNFVGVANSAGDLTSTTQGDFYVIQTAFGVYSVGDQAVYDGSAYVRVTDGTKQITEGGTGATTLPDAKGNLQIPDVGSSPDEVSLNGMLGSMAFQSAEGISVGTVEITDKIDLSGAPTQQLEVYGDAPTLRVTDTSDGVGDGDSIGKLEFYGNDGSSGGVGVRTKIDTVSETAAGNQYGVAISTSSANAAPVERLRVDGLGNVGIASTPVHSANRTTLVIDGVWGGRIDNKFGGAASSSWYTSTSGPTIFGTQNAQPLDLQTNSITRWTINTTGNLVASSGVGIDFGSTPDGSGATGVAEIFDDYETGTVTVGVTCGSGSITLNSSFQYLYYTKIGRTVNFFGELVVSSVSSPSGTIHLTGLPFTSLNQSGGRQAMSIYTRGLASDLGSVVGFVEPNTTTLYLRESGTTGVGNSIANAFQANTEIMFGGSYTAA